MRNKLLKDLIEIPIAMYYILFKSTLSPILLVAITATIMVFIYIVIKK